jgi:hypothetical protein
LPISDGLKNGQKVTQVGGNTANTPKPASRVSGENLNVPKPSRSNTPGGNYWPGVGSTGLRGK